LLASTPSTVTRRSPTRRPASYPYPCANTATDKEKKRENADTEERDEREKRVMKERRGMKRGN
jgi:hypothetical protein